MKQLTASEVHARKVKELGLDPEAIDLTSSEAIASALRRAAEFLCPCSAATLVRTVINPLRGLVDDLEKTKSSVEEVLESIIAHGDILEHRVVSESGYENSPLLYCAPASFVMRDSGTAILLGPTSSSLPEELEREIRYFNHVRLLEKQSADNLKVNLLQLGFLELSFGMWLKAPPVERPADLVARMDRLIEEVSPSRDVPGILLLDPGKPVNYYRGRWVEPKRHTGRFVARRPQAYGMDLWCYVEMRDGQSERLIDFPLPGNRWRGCDDAWRMQMAIDAQRGQPQRFRVRSGPMDTMICELFSPVPLWARRRWDALGEPTSSTACLFAYRFPMAEIEQEIRFVKEELWIDDIHAIQSPH